MINFTCKCGYLFSVPEETSGESFQCPECKLLVDVPYLDDLNQLDKDGTFKVEASSPEDRQRTDAEFRRIYIPTRRDEQGQEYDLRPTPEQIMDSGSEEVLNDNLPKYDPETGELIRPVEIKPDAPEIPTAKVAQTAISYARGQTSGGVTPWKVPVALLMPANLAVLIVVYLLHMLNWLLATSLIGLILLLLTVPLTLVALCAHIGNIIDEIGPSEHDELPGLMRGLSWSDDIWRPTFASIGSLVLCYAPAFYAMPNLRLAGSLAITGTCLFPAVLLTMATSGTILNLRPDRVIKVIRACGWAYPLVVVLWAVSVVIYVASFSGVMTHGMAITAAGFGGIKTVIAAAIAYPALFLGIYLMHMFAWYVGLLYRGYYPKFPWVLQRHDWSLKEEREFRELRRQRGVRPKPRRTPPRQVEPVDQPPIPVEPASAKTSHANVEEIPLAPIEDEPIPLEPIRIELPEEESPKPGVRHNP